ncbi:hypothetical protein [Nocardia jinanensis]|uniref:hypothetical protein n=1 Tax=Nocardia jinanensis TaxID=382504 RepID=UPI0007A529AA|nr:hypothetical protein [Nocardia jinanensis]
MALTTGTRLRSQNSTVEVVVIRGTDDSSPVLCAGTAMSEDAAGTDGAAADGPAILVGKRYVDEAAGVELLCVKAGAGPLEYAGRELTLKSAKPLPSSD